MYKVESEWIRVVDARSCDSISNEEETGQDGGCRKYGKYFHQQY